MPQYDSLKSFYHERGELAYNIEHPLQGATPAWIRRYVDMQGEIRSLETAFAQTWCPPRADAVSLLPWCSICGSSQRPLVPGQTICGVCDGIIMAGTITQGEHAEAPQSPSTVLGRCTHCGQNDRVLLPLHADRTGPHMVCKGCGTYLKEVSEHAEAPQGEVGRG